MRILILSDIHGNLTALEKVLLTCGEFDAVWNLGDTIGYGPRPAECLDWVLQDLPTTHMLVGNHDLACIGEISDDTFNPNAQFATRWTTDKLRPEQVEKIRELKAEAVTASGVRLAHGSPRDPVWEYVATERIALENFYSFSERSCLIGHTHVAMVATLSSMGGNTTLSFAHDGLVLELGETRFIVNPGSVGQPRDRDPRAAYAILDEERMILSLHRVEYDVARTQAQMEEAGLPPSLVVRLAHGI